MVTTWNIQLLHTHMAKCGLMYMFKGAFGDLEQAFQWSSISPTLSAEASGTQTSTTGFLLVLQGDKKEFVVAFMCVSKEPG